MGLKNILSVGMFLYSSMLCSIDNEFYLSKYFEDNKIEKRHIPAMETDFLIHGDADLEYVICNVEDKFHKYNFERLFFEDFEIFKIDFESYEKFCKDVNEVYQNWRKFNFNPNDPISYSLELNIDSDEYVKISVKFDK
jgi:hypothetical protein